MWASNHVIGYHALPCVDACPRPRFFAAGQQQLQLHEGPHHSFPTPSVRLPVPVWVCLGPSGSVWVCLCPSVPLSVPVPGSASVSVCACLCASGPCLGHVWARLGPSGRVCACAWATVCARLGVSGCVCACLCASGPVCAMTWAVWGMSGGGLCTHCVLDDSRWSTWSRWRSRRARRRHHRVR
jgi:hypothetical protein